MAGILRVEVVTPKVLAADYRIPQRGLTTVFFQWLAAFFGGLVSGLGAMVRVSLDESTPVAATGTVVFTQASLTAGDKVIINGIPYTAVAGAATAALGQFSKDTSDTAVGDSFVLALAAWPLEGAYGSAKPIAVGVNTAGSVALTAVKKGIAGNGIVMQEKDAGGGIAITAFSGGREGGSLKNIIGTFTGVPADGGTLTLGSVVLTVAAAPANESEFDGGADAPGAVTSLIACINAHSKLKGIILASVGTTTSKINMQLQIAGRPGALILSTEALSNYTQDGTSYAPLGTEAWAASPVVVAIGPASAQPQAAL